MKNAIIISAVLILITLLQWLRDALSLISIKIHEEAIKELEGRKKKYTPNFQQTEPYVGGHNQALDEAITYHQKEISKLKT